MHWLEGKLAAAYGNDPAGWPAEENVQTSLLQLTVRSVAAAIRDHAADAQEVLVCGGGARNRALMSALSRHLPCSVVPTDVYGLPGQWVEAAAFAWLAWCHENRVPAGLPDVTGAHHPRVLGCKYPARGCVNGSAAGSGREGRPAAAGSGGIGVTDDELCAVEVVFIVDFRTHQILEAHWVDQQFDAFFDDGSVVIIDGFIKGETVLETRTPPALHKHAQLELRIIFFSQQLLHFGCCSIRKDDG